MTAKNALISSSREASLRCARNWNVSLVVMETRFTRLELYRAVWCCTARPAVKIAAPADNFPACDG
jgi:hypothetical protein